jgi:hypothetical protein
LSLIVSKWSHKKRCHTYNEGLNSKRCVTGETLANNYISDTYYQVVIKKGSTALYVYAPKIPF